MEKLRVWFNQLLGLVLIFSLVARYAGFLPNEEITLPVLAILSTLPVLWGSVLSLFKKKLTVDLLAAIALLASLITKEWTSAIFVNLMLASARVLGDYTQGKARAAIKSLLKLRPQKVKVKRGAGIVEENISQIKVNDSVYIESGERVPIDGIVESGEASIDQSSLTGESNPVSKEKGDQVFSSTLNLSGSLVVLTKKVGKDTMLEKIIDLVESSQKGKADILGIAEKFTGWYIAGILAVAATFYFALKDPIIVLGVLLVACADDIAVATPLAFWVAIGNAAKKGIIVKGGNYLEGLARTNTMVVDKTGTLTQGRLRVEEVAGFGSHDRDEVLKLAATVESLSEHPAARAIVDYANQNHVDFKTPEDFDEFVGKGSMAVYQGKKIISGKLVYLQEQHVKISQHEINDITKAKVKGLNTTLVAYDGELIGFMGLADELRPNVAKTINDLRSMGVKKWVMLTGDNEKVAQRVAGAVGITEFHADLLPQDKIRYLKTYINKKDKVTMMGDGVNDAAALALADVGVAMGAIGADASIEAANIALMRDDFSAIPKLIKLGRQTMRIIYQNFWIWGIVNLIGIGLVITRTIGPEGAAAYNFLTDFFPLMNSLRLITYKFDL